jgi:hypothetical protein
MASGKIESNVKLIWSNPNQSDNQSFPEQDIVSDEFPKYTLIFIQTTDSSFMMKSGYDRGATVFANGPTYWRYRSAWFTSPNTLRIAANSGQNNCVPLWIYGIR